MSTVIGKGVFTINMLVNDLNNLTHILVSWSSSTSGGLASSES